MKNTAIKLSIINLALLALTSTAWARQASPEDKSASPLCGVVENVDGDVQLLDGARENLLSALPETQIHCGDWVRVGEGYARLRLKDGHRALIGSQSFLQVLDPLASENTEHDHLILMRGQVGMMPSTTELRVTTANGRARAKDGPAILVYAEDTSESQLVALQKPVTLENRYVPGARITVKPGQASALGTSSARLAPELPKSVLITALADKLKHLRFGPSAQKDALASVKKEPAEEFPAKLIERNEQGEEIHPYVSKPLESYEKPEPIHAVKRAAPKLARALPTAKKASRSSRAPASAPRMAAPEVSAPEPDRDQIEKAKLLEELSRIQTE